MTRDVIAFWVASGLSLPVLALLARKDGLWGMVDDMPALAMVVVIASAGLVGSITAMLSMITAEVLVILSVIAVSSLATYLYLRR